MILLRVGTFLKLYTTVHYRKRLEKVFADFECTYLRILIDITLFEKMY